MISSFQVYALLLASLCDYDSLMIILLLKLPYSREK